jgi:hypothetical protein
VIRLKCSHIVIAALVCAGVPAAAHAQERYALLVEGTSGTPEYAEQHRKWLDDLAKVLHEKLDFDASHMLVLAEDPRAGEQPATAESVRSVFKTLSAKIQPADLLFVMLIGHGTAPAVGDPKYNLVGPDLDVAEWAKLVGGIAGRLVFVDSTSSSSGFVKGLSGPNRVIIVATDSPAMIYHSVFAEGFIAALGSPEADLDKDGRISVWEAFTFASRQVQRHYEQSGSLQPERAALDDDGDGVGREAAKDGKDGSLSGVTFLDAPPSTKTNDPELKRLLQQKDDLNLQIQQLKQRQATMTPDDYAKELERLTTELAVVSREIRRRGGRPLNFTA